MTSNQTGPNPRADREVNPKAVLVTVCLSVLVIGLNTTALNTAIGVIAQDFELSTNAVAWTINAYLIAAAALIAPGGQFGDVFGRRKLLLIGAGVFALGSITAALAPVEGVFIVGRVFQGTGAALMMPAQLSILRLVYPVEKQGSALGIWAAVASLTFAIGPLWGGLFADTIGWRWMFSIDLVFIAIFFFSASRTLPAVKEKLSGRKADYVGAVLLAGAILCLVIVFQQGGVWGWDSPGILGAAVASVVLFGIFWVVDHIVDDPLIHFNLFRNNTYLGGIITTFAQGVGLMGYLYFVSLLVESFALFDYSALDAGFVLLPGGLVMLVAALTGGRIADRTGFRIPNTAAMLFITIGGLVFLTIDRNTSVVTIAILACVMALGVGTGFSTTVAAGMASVPKEVGGEAAGALNVARYMGTVLVVGLGTTIALQVSSNQLDEQLANSGIDSGEVTDLDKAMSQTSQQLTATIDKLPESDREPAHEAVETATVAGFKSAQVLIAFIAAASTVASWYLLRSEGRLLKRNRQKSPANTSS